MQDLRETETKKEVKKPFKLTVVSKEELEKAIAAYNSRKRRFGGV